MAYTIAYTHFLTRITISRAIYDLLAWHTAPSNTDAGMRAGGVIESALSTRYVFATACPQSYIQALTAMTNTKRTPSLLDNRSRCKLRIEGNCSAKTCTR